jgi:3-methyladenine DNA glycosylase AlkC
MSQAAPCQTPDAPREAALSTPLKDRLGPDAARALARRAREVWPPFDAEAFLRAALGDGGGLDPLELRDRVRHLARHLRAHLPPFPAALRVLAALRPTDAASRTDGAFLAWPVLQAIEDGGLDHPVESLDALAALTGWFSAEFAVRPYLVRHPELAWATLGRWADAPDPHLRRLASEGSRPRLPWASRLPAAVADPTPGLAILHRLVDDPDPYVRRSVANHLGDVAKDHPIRAVDTARAWLVDRADRRALVRHGLRDLLKRGHPGALALFDEGGVAVDVRDLTLTPTELAVGEPVTLTATLTARAAGKVRVDVVWSWPSARGGWSSKTFVGAVRALRPGEVWRWEKALSTAPVSTRPTRPGVHRLTLRAQGQDVASATFTLHP